MTFSDYLIDISLIGLVLVQVKSRRLTVRALLLPIGIVAYVAFSGSRDRAQAAVYAHHHGLGDNPAAAEGEPAPP